MPLLLVLALVALWWLPLNQLMTEWIINPQYSHGWLVPLLTLYLFWQRWLDRPEPRPSSSRRRRGLLIALTLVTAATLLPVRIIQEANPDWRLMGFSLTAAAAALTLLGITWCGGRVWLRHFALPVLFIFCAVAWPTGLENAVVQNLMRAVAGLSVEVLNWVGVPAIQHGNMIETDTGIVSVAEACSGLNTVQATIMAAIFFGELDRLSVVLRCALIPAGFFLAFFCNWLRAMFLISLSMHGGPARLAEWHDVAGYIEMIVCILSLYGVAAWFHTFRRASKPPFVIRDAPRVPRLLPKSVFVALIAWLVAVEVGTQGWFNWHEREMIDRDRWTIHWPVDQPDYHEVPIADRAASMLRYNEGRAVAWSGGGSHQWAMFFFRWKPGRAAAQLARSHNPEICLPASGRSLQKDLGMRVISAGKLQLPFHAYIFSDRNVPIYVFYCSWEDKAQADSGKIPKEDWSARSRIAAAWAGRRHLGQQVLEILLSGVPDSAAAQTAVESQLQDIIQPEKT